MGRRYKSNRKNKNKPKNDQRGGGGGVKRKGGGKHNKGPDNYSDSYTLTVVENGNEKFEAYYAAQNLHGYHWKASNDDDTAMGGGDEHLVACETSEEKQAERKRWRSAISTILPSSFRMGNDLPSNLRDHLEKELMECISTTTIPQATRSARMTKDTAENNADSPTVSEESQEKREEKQEKDSGNKVTPTKHNSNDDGKITKVIHKLQFLPYAYQLALDRTTLRKNPALATLHNWIKDKTEAGFLTRQETVSMIPPVVLQVQPTDKVLDLCAAPGSKTSQLLQDLGPTGTLIANDLSLQRAHMLVHQLKKLMNKHPVALFTSSDAQFFPSSVTQFDKILADVPCSGDGTTRKNVDIWKTWNQLQAFALHQVQINIAWKGAAQLLKVGGCMVYSTCSLNPIENEAVVAELLRRSKGQLELVECSLKGFKTRPGMIHWKVFCEPGNPKSNRQMKNERKKNNAKLQQRRQQWKGKEKQDGEEKEEETSAAKKDEDGTVKEEQGTTTTDKKNVEENKNADDNGGNPKESNSMIEEEDENNKDDKAETKDEDNNDENGKGDEDTGGGDEPKKKKKFEPTDMADEVLMEMVKDAGLHHYSTFDDVPESMHARIRPSCFPPSATSEEKTTLHLERCIRCLGHDNDTGGFFVALLRKVGPIGKADRRAAKQDGTVETSKGNDEDEAEECAEPAAKRLRVASAGTGTAESAAPQESNDAAMNVDGADDSEEKTENVEVVDATATALPDDMDEVDDLNGDDDGDEYDDEDRKPPRGSHPLKVNLLRDKDGKAIEGVGKDDFIPVKDEIMDSLIERYGLSPSTFEKDLYMTRASGVAKVLYYVSRPIKNLIDAGIQKQVTVVHSGLKAFVRDNREDNVTYRICQEGAHFLVPHMTKRLFVASRTEFEKFLTGKCAKLDTFAEDLSAKIRALTPGAFLVLLEGFEERLDEKLVVAVWRGRGENVDGLVSKIELQAIKSKLKAIVEVAGDAEAGAS